MTIYKVMFVDDEYMILEGLKMLVKWNELGFEVVKTAKSANEALAYLQGHSIDLLITDINMPEMSGIDLVRNAQKLNQSFFTIILSGYQEFAFVKQGMQLGVKNYLVKPVNKEELKRSVEEIYQELESQKQLAEQKDLYIETSLMLWLSDELNEDEFQNLLYQIPQTVCAPYTPVLVEGIMENVIKITDYFKKIQQSVIVESRIHDGQAIIIFCGTRQQLLIYIRDLEHAYLEMDWQIILGETVHEWENLYKSYEKIRQIQELQAFYPDLTPKEKIIKVEITNREELPFISFNKALMIGDRQTIQNELNKIFEQLLVYQVDPEQVKYISFLLFTDIYRQSPTLSEADYELVISKIRQSDTIMVLRYLFDDVLEMTKSKTEAKRYSETIQKILVLLGQEYMEEISLKSISETFHLSVVYLGQLFKKEVGMSFNQYLNQLRMKKAQNLLLHTQQTIHEISDEIGYNNANYFSKMFKKLNGITPKEFRDQYRTNYESF